MIHLLRELFSKLGPTPETLEKFKLATDEFKTQGRLVRVEVIAVPDDVVMDWECDAAQGISCLLR